MKKKINFVDYIVPMGVMLVGIASIVFAIICFSYSAYGIYDSRCVHVRYENYGGDAYTGIQHAAAATANNIAGMLNGIAYAVEDLQTTSGFFFIIIGVLLLVLGLNKFFKVVRKNKEKQTSVQTTNSTKNN